MMVMMFMPVTEVISGHGRVLAVIRVQSQLRIRQTQRFDTHWLTLQLLTVSLTDSKKNLTTKIFNFSSIKKNTAKQAGFRINITSDLIWKYEAL